MKTKILALIIILITGISTGFSAEAGDELPPGANPGHTTNVAADLTADEKQEGLERFSKELDIISEIVNNGDPNSLNTRMMAHKKAEAQRLVDRRDALLGSSGDIQSGRIPILGLGSAQWTIQASNPNFLRGYSAPGQYFQIVGSGDNLAAPIQRAMDKAKNKIGSQLNACGAFDWVAQMKQNFNKEALKEYVSALQEGVLAAAPMALLANFSPTLYEIVKHLKALASIDISAQLRNCELMENALINVGQKAIRGTGYGDCMNANASMGISAANRHCNQYGPSMFDGLENSLGRIVSPSVDGGTINIVEQLQSFLNPGRDPILQQEYFVVAKALEVSEEQLEANPLPAGDPNAWTPEQREAKERHDAAVLANMQAQQAYDTISASRSADPTGILGNLRNAVTDNLPNILGDITISIRGDLEIGKQPRLHIKLMANHAAHRWAQELRIALINHWGYIRLHYSGTPSGPSQANLSASYNVLRAHTWETSQFNWTRYGASPFSDMDLDRLSYMWYSFNLHEPGSSMRATFNARWPVDRIINAISDYETAVFALQEFDTLQIDLMNQLSAFESGRNRPVGTREVIESQLSEYRIIMTERKVLAEEALAELLPILQQFTVPRFTVSNFRAIGPQISNQSGPRFFTP